MGCRRRRRQAFKMPSQCNNALLWKRLQFGDRWLDVMGRARTKQGACHFETLRGKSTKRCYMLILYRFYNLLHASVGLSRC